MLPRSSPSTTRKDQEPGRPLRRADGGKVHLITCHNDMARNIEKCVEKVGLRVDQLIFSALASSYAVLTEDEKELGVCVVDIGGGTMDMSLFTGGALRHTKVIPYAGSTVTSDIAYAFGTPPLDAEAIKRCAMAAPSAGWSRRRQY